MAICLSGPLSPIPCYLWVPGKHVRGAPSVARSCERVRESFIPAPSISLKTGQTQVCGNLVTTGKDPPRNFLGTDTDRIIGTDSGSSLDKFKDELDNLKLKEV